MEEVWKPVVGYEGLYEISNFGRLRSLDKPMTVYRGGKYIRPGKLLTAKVSTHTPPRHITELYRDGKGRWHSIHRLVLLAFVGPAPEGTVACHNDGNPSNNSIANLRWDTPRANAADSVKHGTKVRGEKHWAAKTTEGCVQRMFDLRRMGCTFTAIGKWLNMSRAQVSQIVKGQHWKHLNAG